MCPESKRFKQLGLLAQGFLVELLRSSEEEPIILNEISQKEELSIMHKNQPGTRLRRLYDLANIFVVLGIVRKVKSSNSKPGYVWQGV